MIKYTVVIINNSIKYMVVIINMDMPSLFKPKEDLILNTVTIFSSKTREWKKLRFSIPDVGLCWDETSVACNGIIYWKLLEIFSILKAIIVFNPLETKATLTRREQVFVCVINLLGGCI